MESRVRTLYKIEAQPEGPAKARCIIAQELSAVLSPNELNDMKLMVSELVTNGIVHGHPKNDVPVMLDLCVNGDIRWRCSTRDPGSSPAFGAMRARVGDCVSSSNSQTGGGCSVRHGTPKYGSNAVAHELVPRGLRPPASFRLA